MAILYSEKNYIGQSMNISVPQTGKDTNVTQQEILDTAQTLLNNVQSVSVPQGHVIELFADDYLKGTPFATIQHPGTPDVKKVGSSKTMKSVRLRRV
jgi:hypothetical protein